MIHQSTSMSVKEAEAIAKMVAALSRIPESNRGFLLGYAQGVLDATDRTEADEDKSE